MVCSMVVWKERRMALKKVVLMVGKSVNVSAQSWVYCLVLSVEMTEVTLVEWVGRMVAMRDVGMVEMSAPTCKRLSE